MKGGLGKREWMRRDRRRVTTKQVLSLRWKREDRGGGGGGGEGDLRHFQLNFQFVQSDSILP